MGLQEDLARLVGVAERVDRAHQRFCRLLLLPLESIHRLPPGLDRAIEPAARAQQLSQSQVRLGRVRPAADGVLEGRLGLSTALGALGHRSAVDSLQQAALDERLDATSRAGACAALGRVTERSEAPWQSALLVDSNYMLDERTPVERILGLP